MERYDDPILKETLYKETLPSGLPIFVVPRPGFKQATAVISTDYGSLDRSFVKPDSGEQVTLPDGVAHFLEHKLFESEDGDAMSKFAALGASSNAFTSFKITAYHFTTTANFSESLDVLMDMVQSPWFTPESVQKEQGIIGQEIQRFYDSPESRSFYGTMEALYHRHAIRVPVIGSVESISHITADLLYDCHRTFYHPSNLMLIAVGDLDPQRVVEQAAANFGQHGYAQQAKIRRLHQDEPPTIVAARKDESLTVAQPIFRLGFKDTDIGQTGLDLQRKDLLTNLVLDAVLGKSSPLYTSLYEAGLIDQRFGYGYDGGEDYGWTIIGGPTRDPEGLEQKLRAGLEQARQQGLDADAFTRAKKKAMGRFLSDMSASESIAFLWNDLYFKGMDLFQWIPIGNSLTLDEANARLRQHFDPGVGATVVVHPKT